MKEAPKEETLTDKIPSWLKEGKIRDGLLITLGVALLWQIQTRMDRADTSFDPRPPIYYDIGMDFPADVDYATNAPAHSQTNLYKLR